MKKIKVPYWLGVLALLLASCSQAAATPAPVNKSLVEAPAAPALESLGAPAADMSRGSSTGYTDTTSTANAGSADRLVIKNANLAIVVLDPSQAMDSISKLAASMGGYVVSSNTYKITTDNGIEVPEADITIRVPVEKLDEALSEIKKLVKNPQEDILSENVSGQDVTQEYTDLQSRLDNLQQTEKQLREIMASATKTEDVMSVFNQLTQVREQIEVLQGQIKYYQTSASLSAIKVDLKAQASVQPLSIGGWQPVGVARNAVQALLNTLRFLANAVIYLVILILPIVLIIYLPLRLIWVGIRRWRAKRKTNRPAPPQNPAPPAVK
jgi:hypothetical protein